MRRIPPLLLLLLALPARALDTAGFSSALSPHFELYHQSSFAPAGLTLELERIHNRLRMDLSMFAPWMAKERVKILVYSGRKAYASGELRPPSWSNGIALYDQRVVATYEQPPKGKLFEVLGHELSHLFFESYWGETHRKPPVWLNEGLAMLEETDPKDAQDSDWYRAMGIFADGGALKLESFFRVNPSEDLKTSESVSRWYAQAYSVVYFLYRRHSRQQFFNFCSQLRNGKELRESLWLVYRYPSVDKLQTAWMDWLRMPGTRPQGSLRAPSASVVQPTSTRGSALKPTGFRGFGFRSLLPDEKK